MFIILFLNLIMQVVQLIRRHLHRLAKRLNATRIQIVQLLVKRFTQRFHILLCCQVDGLSLTFSCLSLIQRFLRLIQRCICERHRSLRIRDRSRCLSHCRFQRIQARRIRRVHLLKGIQFSLRSCQLRLRLF